MTNVEGPSSSRAENFSGAESAPLREPDVQLTELLPVKKMAAITEDEAVADAFKALREGNKHFSINGGEFRGDENEGRIDNGGEEGAPRATGEKRGNRVHDKRVKYLENRAKTKQRVRTQEAKRKIAVVGGGGGGAFDDPSKIEARRASDSADNAKGEDDDHGLREKIDAIIQANYVLERKNNNTTRENLNSPKNSESAENSDGGASGGTEGAGPRPPPKKHRCAICKARFKGSGGLRTHYKVVHAAGPTFTCDECGKEFPLKERLKLHVRTHTGYKPYKCNECEKSFARGGQLVQHRRTHTQVKPYRCLICPGTFSCAANLALHVKRHNGQKDHKCDICGRAFVRRDALKKHLECLHKDVKSFLCVICNKTFKGHLPQHMRTHAQDRPHGCATCGQRFAQKSQLTVHQRTHSGQRPFRCLVCWQAFAHSTALKLHTRRHTGERPFKCAECNAGFTQLPHWKKHMRCVHGRTDPYRCKNCDTFFRIKNDLETHEKGCVVEEQRLGNPEAENRGGSGRPVVPKYRIMTVEKMRLLLAVLFKRISKPERLDELGFGKRLIDQVLEDSLLSAGKYPAESNDSSEFEVLKKNLATFLEWTVPREHWEAFKKLNKTPEEILETLTVSQ
ncbi:zinc finger protein 497-like [Athalia rosae]|uniref:zinc finger protein 497-like n=1 Tax=Athalia rosae TaxID=37344 RepID=UPI002034517B|nr:zinc finger protein 497-like [Athalia rosae]XP_048513966.1 zinc finger protein 497-like [Athalia rosae]